MIERVTELVGQLAGFVRHHVPPGLLPDADKVAVVLLVVGILLAVLGAKLARVAVLLCFVGLGVWLGLRSGRTFEQQSGFPLAASVVIGAVVVGGIGYALFRLWVGLGTAILLATLAVGVYGAQKIVPHVASFEEQFQASPEFVIPDVSSGERDAWESVRSTCRDFWAHVKSRESDVERKTVLIAMAVGLFGFILGLCAVRFTLVAFSALAGTGLVVAAIGLVLQQHYPEAFAVIQQNPRALAGVILGFLGASLVLQTLLTRCPPRPKPVANP